MRRARLLGLLYLTAGLGLAGWVVNLWRSLNERSTAYHLPVVKGAVGILLVGVLLVLVLVDVASDHHESLSATPSPTARLAGLAVVVLGIATEWFLLLPGAATRPTDVIFATVVALDVALVAAVYRRRTLAAHRRALLVTAGSVTTAGVVAFVLGSEATVLGTRQPLVWGGLDVAELVAVVLTGVRLLRGRRAFVPATCAACLFLLDATINVTVASGDAFAAALAMACLEVPAAGLSAVIAYRSAMWPVRQSD